MRKGEPGYRRDRRQWQHHEVITPYAHVILLHYKYTKEAVRIASNSDYLHHFFERFIRGACYPEELLRAVDVYLYHRQKAVIDRSRKPNQIARRYSSR
jgi:hypothetical protein